MAISVQASWKEQHVIDHPHADAALPIPVIEGPKYAQLRYAAAIERLDRDKEMRIARNDSLNLRDAEISRRTVSVRTS